MDFAQCQLLSNLFLLLLSVGFSGAVSALLLISREKRDTMQGKTNRQSAKAPANWPGRQFL